MTLDLGLQNQIASEKKSWSISNTKLLYEYGKDFLDRQYVNI